MPGKKDFWRERGESEMGIEQKPDLLQFLIPSDEPLSLLVIESLDYLPQLRSMFPAASLYVVTAEGKAALDGLDAVWEILDYRETPLPFQRESFDFLLGGNLASTVSNPQDILAGLGTFLKPTGRLLTSFENIRYWRVLESLMEGHYWAVVRRLFARQDFETLLYASFFKDAFFIPVMGAAPGDLKERLLQAGFEDENDMETEFWLVDAWRSSRQVSYLKAQYTPAIRRRLVTLLRRIEYGIKVEENTAALWRLMEEEKVTAGYLSAFIGSTVVHTAEFYEALRRHAEEDQWQMIERYALSPV